MTTLRKGNTALYDTFAGTIRCKVLGIAGVSGWGGTSQHVKVELTEDCGPYKRGEVEITYALWVVPKDCIRGNRILPYQVECDVPLTHEDLSKILLGTMKLPL